LGKASEFGWEVVAAYAIVEKDRTEVHYVEKQAHEEGKIPNVLVSQNSEK